MTDGEEQQGAVGSEQAGQDPIERARARVGRRIREWQLDELLGVGGMGAVFAASDPNGAVAALKILHLPFVQDDIIRARFEREASVSNLVDHPGCVRVIDRGTTEQGEPYLILELLEGETLQERLKRLGRLPVQEALDIAQSVLAALAACHARGVIHRDLKPGNVFLLSDGRVKLVDFGVAQLRDERSELTRAGVAVGTPSYMAPEQALGRQEQIDGRTDVYALGATLYAALSGKPLHAGRNDAEAQILAATQPAPSLARAAPELPAEVLALVDRALQWNRGNRFQSAAEMREAIRRLQETDRPAWSSGGAARHEALAVAEASFELDWEPSSPEAAPPGERGASAGVSAGGPSEPPAGTGGGGDEGYALELDFGTDPQPPAAVAVAGGAPSAPAAAAPAAATSAPPPEASRDADQEQTAEAVRTTLQSLFTALDRLLRTARQYGPAHPETRTWMDPVSQAIQAAVAACPAGVSWTVLPFSFTAGEVAWEPEPPGDLVPYTLSVAGLREIRLLPGISDDEARELLTVMMVDANSDPSEIAAALWDAQLTHVRCRLEEDRAAEDSAAEDEVWGAADDLAQELDRLLEEQPSATQRLAHALAQQDIAEAASLAAAADLAAAESAEAALALDEASAAELRAGLALGPDEIRQRHIDVALDALADAVARRDPATVAVALAARTKRLMRLGRYEEVFATHRELCERLEQARQAGAGPLSATLVTHAMFSSESLRNVVQLAGEWRDLVGVERSREALGGLKRICRSLGPSALRVALGIADRTAPGEAQELLLDYVERVAPGQEQRIFDAVEGLQPLLAQRVLTRVLSQATAEAKALARPLLRSANAAVRCEALAHLADSPDQLSQELMTLFAGADPAARQAALDTFVRHRVLSVGPALVREVERDSFRGRPPDEQRNMLEAICALHPARAVRLLIAIVAKHGLVGDESTDRARTLAVELLGHHGADEDALAAAEAASRRRPWNTSALREVAGRSVAAIRARLQQPPAGTEGAS